jgi:hypothetical protein
VEEFVVRIGEVVIEASGAAIYVGDNDRLNGPPTDVYAVAAIESWGATVRQTAGPALTTLPRSFAISLRDPSATAFNDPLLPAAPPPLSDFEFQQVVFMWSSEAGDVLATITGAVTSLEARTGAFRRGDATDDATVDIADAIFVLNYLFNRGAAPSCLEAADGNDDGKVDISDGVAILRFLYLGWGPPPDPGPFECGPDPVGSAGYVGCESSLCANLDTE